MEQTVPQIQLISAWMMSLSEGMQAQKSANHYKKSFGFHGFF